MFNQLFSYRAGLNDVRVFQANSWELENSNALLCWFEIQFLPTTVRFVLGSTWSWCKSAFMWYRFFLLLWFQRLWRVLGCKINFNLTVFQLCRVKHWTQVCSLILVMCFWALLSLLSHSSSVIQARNIRTQMLGQVLCLTFCENILVDFSVMMTQSNEWNLNQQLPIQRKVTCASGLFL